VRGERGQCRWQWFAPVRSDSGGVEPAAPLPGPAARTALPGLARQASQYRHGVAGLINPTNSPPWLALKTLWFSVPAYQGPFVIRAQRLGRPGPVALGEGPTVAPLVVPPGPTLNGTGGWREAPGGLWVRAPGCYAWQVDGLTFSETIVVRAVLH
jgi:hypothetical protein